MTHINTQLIVSLLLCICNPINAQSNTATVDINTQFAKYSTDSSSTNPLTITLSESGGSIPVEAYHTSTTAAVYDYSYVSNTVYGRVQGDAFTSVSSSTPVTIGLALIDSGDYPVTLPSNALFGELYSGVYDASGHAILNIPPDDYDVIITYDTTRGTAQCVQYSGNDNNNNPIWSTDAIGTINGPNSNQVTCQIITPGNVFTLQAMPTTNASTTSATPTTTAPTTTTASTNTSTVITIPTVIQSTAPATTRTATTTLATTTTTNTASTIPPTTTSVTTTVLSSTAASSSAPQNTTLSGSTTDVAPGSPLTLPAIPANSQRIEFNLYGLTAQVVNTDNYDLFVSRLQNDLSSVLSVSPARFIIEQGIYNNSTHVINTVVDILPGTTGSANKFQLHSLHYLDVSAISLAEQLSNETAAELSSTTYLKHIDMASLVSCNLNNLCTQITPSKSLTPSTQSLNGNTSSSPGFLSPSRYLWVPIVCGVVGVILLSGICCCRRRQYDEAAEEMYINAIQNQKQIDVPPVYQYNTTTTPYTVNDKAIYDTTERDRGSSESAGHYRFTDYKTPVGAIPINNTSSTYNYTTAHTRNNSYSNITDDDNDVIISYDTHTPNTYNRLQQINATSTSPQRFVYAPADQV